MMMMGEKKDKVCGGSPLEVVLGQVEGSSNNTMRTAETVLRVVPMALCIAALVVMLKTAQTNDFGSVSYNNLGAFRYLVYANGVCAGYSLLSAFYTAVPGCSTISQAWTLFFLDQVLTYGILGAGTVSAEVLYLAYNGDEAITWSAACEIFGGFCGKATMSVTITFVAVAFYVSLSLISSYRLFTNYDAPITTTYPPPSKA